jgi:septum formation protein
MPRLILASRSPFRLALLREAGYDVEVVAAEQEEPDPSRFSDLEAGLLHVARFKARGAHQAGAAGLILAADTVGTASGSIFGKPIDRNDAERMLRAISGTTHAVLTGWCLLRTRDGLNVGGVERTAITMRPWSEPEILAYLDSREWVGKSGAYGLVLPRDPFVTHLEGSASNVVGVPLERLARVLDEMPSLCR